MSFRIGKKPDPPKEAKKEEKKDLKKEEKKEENRLKTLEKSLEKIGLLVLLESKMKISKMKIVVLFGLMSIYSILTLMDFYGQYLSNLLAFLYPSYQSMIAIDQGEKGNYKQWLSFWYEKIIPYIS